MSLYSGLFHHEILKVKYTIYKCFNKDRIPSQIVLIQFFTNFPIFYKIVFVLGKSLGVINYPYINYPYEFQYSVIAETEIVQKLLSPTRCSSSTTINLSSYQIVKVRIYLYF